MNSIKLQAKSRLKSAKSDLSTKIMDMSAAQLAKLLQSQGVKVKGFEEGDDGADGEIDLGGGFNIQLCTDSEVAYPPSLNRIQGKGANMSSTYLGNSATLQYMVHLIKKHIQV